MKRIFLPLFLLFFSWILFPDPVLAAGEFSVSYDVTYTIAEDGTGRVTQNIDLTNLTNRFFAKEYTLSIRSNKVENVSAKDRLGPLEISTEEIDDGTAIHVIFNDKVVGSNRTLSWSLAYSVPRMASKNGNVWEVIIPGVAEQEDVARYDVSLNIPISFGEPSFLSPKPRNDRTIPEKKTNYLSFIYHKEDVLKSGITLQFGRRQTYAFQLQYHLSNPNVVPIFTDITLPPDTALQSVVYTSFSPQPEDVNRDEDGNTIARYQLTAGQKIDVLTAGQIKVRMDRELGIPKLSNDLRGKLTAPNRYWEVGHADIVKKAQELRSPQAIYDFVRNFLKYDYGRANQDSIERMGALQSLREPNKAVCMEFTDLFIAIARAAGIPAREVNGYGFTTNRKQRPLSLRATTDVLHSWPEYWDEKLGWVPVDPTWASTTGGIDYFSSFDLNHVALAIHGTSSRLPYPAGSFKYEKEQGPDISFSFPDTEVEQKGTISLSFDIDPTIPAGFPSKGKVVVRNNGNTFLSASPLTIITKKTRVLGPSTIPIGMLPAFSHREVDLTFYPDGWWTSEDETITVQTGEIAVSKHVKIRPISAMFFVPWIFGIAGSVAILAVSYGIVRTIRRKQIAAAFPSISDIGEVPRAPSQSEPKETPFNPPQKIAVRARRVFIRNPKRPYPLRRQS